MKQTKTQNQIIIKLLKNWTTFKDAYEKAKSLSFPKRIMEIKAMGYDLESKWVDLPSGKRVKAWRMKK